MITMTNKQFLDTNRGQYYYYQEGAYWYFGACGFKWSIKTPFRHALQQVIDYTILIDNKE